jgi:hypothetical protein
MSRFNNTERQGVNEVERIFLAFHWIPRTILQTDVGIDMEVEICKDGNPTGKLFAVQIKSGESYFKEQDIDSIIFRPSDTHLDYWLNHSLPVLIVLHSPKTGKTIWENVSKENVRQLKKTRKIHIPLNQLLNQNSRAAIELMNNYPTPYLHLLRLQLDRSLMEKINEGIRIILEVHRWVNKSIGRAELALINADDSTNDEIISRTDYIFFKGIQDVYTLFPWANFQIDEDYYDYEERDAYNGEHGIWDPEDKVYLFREDNYDNYKKMLPKIRPLPDNDGELESYRLEMSLNQIGEAFLTMEDYLYDR